MKVVRGVVLVAAAVITTKIAIAEGGVAFSLAQLISELTPSESDRRQAYEVVIGFCVPGLLLAIATGALILREAKQLPSSKLAYSVAAGGAVLYGAHLIAAYALAVQNVVLNDFVSAFVWVSELGVAVVLVLLALSLAKPNKSNRSSESALT